MVYTTSIFHIMRSVRSAIAVDINMNLESETVECNVSAVAGLLFQALKFKEEKG